MPVEDADDDSGSECETQTSCDDDSGSECETQAICDRHCSRFCSRCEAIKFDESKYGGYQECAANGHKFLQLNKWGGSAGGSFVPEGPEATGIGAYAAIPLATFEDQWPELPDLRSRAHACDFCKFLRKGLRSDEVRLAILDQADAKSRAKLSNDSIRIKATLSYSWEPERRKVRFCFAGDNNRDPDDYHESGHVGLDALYVQVTSVNPRRTIDRGNPVVPEGVICELRYSVVTAGNIFSATRARNMWNNR
jgi:hypothetical protein